MKYIGIFISYNANFINNSDKSQDHVTVPITGQVTKWFQRVILYCTTSKKTHQPYQSVK
jgi:hypothetical protein